MSKQVIDIRLGDCRDVLETLPNDSVDSLVTDPPAGISFMNQSWDTDKGGRANWIAWLARTMHEALRVVKPGAYALVWAIPRTSHWTATALEHAGFEIRDVITHHFGSGFPKSMDIAKALDKALGVQSEVIGTRPQTGAKFQAAADLIDNGGFNDPSRTEFEIKRAASALAREWEGWGTALKPGTEHWILCRKAPDGTVAENIMAHGVGGINVDGCRIERGVNDRFDYGVSGDESSQSFNSVYSGPKRRMEYVPDGNGRWPANLILTHSQECGLYCVDDCPVRAFGDEARYFKVFKWNFIYCPKPTMAEKNDGLEGFDARNTKDGRKSEIDNAFQRGETQRKNFHPTVKSIELMDYLIRLITPPGGRVLDCFMGSGTTGVAAIKGGWGFVGIERDPEFFQIASARIEAAKSGQQSLFSTEVAS